MSQTPELSVVMGVYNGEARLAETLASVLGQEQIALELVVVDDGSTDRTSQILKGQSSREPRLVVIRQENGGLTRALARGCAAARGRYIARQDAGDISLPGRFRAQLDYIAAEPNASFVSCGTRFVGPGGEYLYDVVSERDRAQDTLMTLDLNKIRGPSHHGSTLFSRALYERVGGYRSAFYFAQDLDLWIRLGEHGSHLIMSDILYQATMTVGAISSIYRNEQLETAARILESASLRRRGLSDAPVLSRAEKIRPPVGRSRSRRERANALYFIGTCLRQHRDGKAAEYFKEALRTYPLHLKSAARLLIG